MMRKHYVEFFSPGTFFNESTLKPIDSWDIAKAVEMANETQERHGAKPYGFEFKTMLEQPDVSDGEGGLLPVMPKKVDESGLHWLGGELMLFHEISPSDDTRILRDNMRCNRWPFVVVNNNSYRYTMQFDEDACIVDADGKIVRRGTDADLVAYREKFIADCEAYYEAQRKEWAAK